MDWADETVAYLRDQREASLADLKAIDEGILSLRENRGTYWVNVTDGWAAKLRLEIERLDRLLAAREVGASRPFRVMEEAAE